MRRFTCADRRFADEVDGLLEIVVELLQFRILRDGGAHGRGFGPGQFAEQQRGDAQFEFFAGIGWQLRVHNDSAFRKRQRKGHLAGE